MRLSHVLALTLMLVSTGSVLGTTFIVPTDDELIGKSRAIVIGTVEGSYVQDENDIVETVYEIRVERALKGVVPRDELIRVVSLGGVLDENTGVIVPAAARYRPGERVLIFLTRDERGRWRTADMTLGRFEFLTSERGRPLLVRDMEHVRGWDRIGRVHQERLRTAEGFVAFIEQRVRGGGPAANDAGDDYFVDASETVFEDSSASTFEPETNAPAFPAPTYTDWVSSQPIRWANMSAGVTFWKRSDQNITGAADGGVGAIQSGLAVWTNECGSAIHLVYGGQRSTASANHDGINVVEYNDPQARISGSWTGSGTVAITFMSFSGSHSFNGTTWWNITDADVVFQNGYSATNASFAAAMTHELGHGLGWRHSNQDYATGGACNPATQECTSAAIMNSSVSGNYGYTLQPWDINAAQAVYPGGTCSTCTAPSITNQPASVSILPGASTTLTVATAGTAPFSYQWYIGTSGNTANPIAGATGASVSVAPGFTTSYWVRVTNACGSANSGTATVTVSTTSLAPATAAGLHLVTPCRMYDSRNFTALPSGTARIVQAAGVCGIPTGAKSVVINVTAVSPAGNGILTTYPGTGTTPPNTITTAYRTGKTRASNTIMRLSSDGRLAVYNSGVQIHFIIDVTGYFQ